MTEEEKNGIPAETPVETTSTEQPAVPADDGGNFEETDNFGGDVDAAVGFEDNFGLGDQQLSAGRIPSVPSSAPKKKAPAPPVTPRSAEPETENTDRASHLQRGHGLPLQRRRQPGDLPLRPEARDHHQH